MEMIAFVGFIFVCWGLIFWVCRHHIGRFVVWYLDAYAENLRCFGDADNQVCVDWFGRTWTMHTPDE